MEREPAPLRRNRPFQRLVVAKVANELSSAVSNVALPLLVLAATGSATLAGVSLFFASAALVVMQIFGGAITDRYRADRTLRFSSLFQAIGWALVLLAALTPNLSMPLVIGGATIAGAASGLDGPSEFALLKALVDQRHFGRATAIGQGREAAAGLTGGPLAGALFAISSFVPFAIQIGLHLLATAATPRRSGAVPKTEHEKFLTEVGKGFALVIRNPGLRGIAIVTGIANFPVVALPLTLIAYYEDTGVSAFLIGLFASTFGVGMLIGAALAGPLASRFRLGTLGFMGIAIFAVGHLAIIFSHASFWLTCLILVLAALPLPAFNAAVGSYTTAITPEHLMGRIVAATGVPGMILMPLGSLAAGILYDGFGPIVPLTVSAITAVLAALTMWLTRALRTIPRVHELKEFPHETAKMRTHPDSSA